MQQGDPMQCGAKTRKGSRCVRPAGWGTDHLGTGRCRNHGGASPQAQLAGVVQLARREASVMGAPLDVDPIKAILECIAIVAGEVQYCSARIAELEEHEAAGKAVLVVERPLKDMGGAEDPSVTVEERREQAPGLHIWIVARREAMDRLVQYSNVAIKAGIAERQVSLAEQQGELIARVLRGVLVDLGIHDHPEVPTVVRRHLALVASA